MAMWVSLKISKGITEPIGALAKATGDIASGNLDVRINIERDDEIGTLVESFNHMVVELKESKKSLETAYFDSNRRRVCMESILENIDSGVISLDTDGKILTINSSACRILGIDPSFIFERELDYHFLLTHIGSEEFKRFIRSINLKDIKAVKEQMSIHVQGKKHIIRIFITQLTLPDGQPTGMLVVFDDLTDVIRAQRALTWQDVARRIAHEIKNPLTPIKLSAERILKKWNNKADDLESTIQKSANTIVREVDGLRKLVDEFSRFGKMPEIRKEKIDLRNLFAEVIDLYKDYGDIRISVDIPEDIPPVEVDPQQFKRVIINLFDNAINAMEGRGELTVKLDETGGKKNVLTLEIADTGAGIDDADKDKLFLPYFSKKKDGTGLGLAISHRIIAEHGGTITVADNVPRGARFIIQIPV
jgi:two-component system nitrogen regulation sensor histidine kinase NtrY